MKEAQELLDNRVYNAIIYILRQKAFEEWQDAHTVEERESIYARINTLDWLDSELRSLTDDFMQRIRTIPRE